jgi:hypothetical protein
VTTALVRASSRSRSDWRLAAALLRLLFVAAVALRLLAGRADVAWGLLVGPLLIAAVAPTARRVAGTEKRFDLLGIMLTGLSLKLLGTFARYVVATDVYGDADAFAYHEQGLRLAESFRSLDFRVVVGRAVPGTGTIRIATGVLYSLVGGDVFVGFLVFGILGFLGALCFYRAMVIAVPAGDHRRYALLLFLWPSLLFWPSSIGKESWMLLSLGLAALGGARLLTRRAGGLWILAAGCAGCALVRPHVALFVVAGLGVAYVVRPSRPTPGVLGKTLGVGALLVVSLVVAAQVRSFFEIDDFSPDSISETLTSAQDRSTGGGSAFTPVKIGGPQDLPLAFATVLLRPFPHEARNAQSAASAVEGLGLLVLLVRSVRRWRQLGAGVRRHAYLVAAGTFVLLFVYAFASIGNFGILARQRTQVLPFLFVLLSLAPATARSARHQLARR